ncbi:MAG: hypothetical protein ACI867_000653 [Glaciecola sp.]|jgi:uncharacterized protein (TIGR02453 family)
MAADTFTGFSKDTSGFLAGLREHNNKVWFDEQRPVYDEHVMAPARAFVEAAGMALQEISPKIRADPRVNGSIFRINRDTRFSKNKTPYKDHLDFWFWDDTERNQAVSGYFLRITPDTVGVGVGAHGFTPEQLTHYRGLVVAPGPGQQLRDAVTQVEQAGFAVKGEHYKRPPKGFAEPQDDRVARLLRHNALWIGEDFAPPATLSSARFVSWCMTRWRKQRPLHDWLVTNMQ